ncbi:MAG: hypothetical protein HON90_11365 [Halobacteriovoraceae bacterium]|jgi:protein tyrosine phosphatase (PTP) superfamily phosphohydrolase (DUF442 family)|nr:hypothetical protein [Halobacteriovoraceae bacterium]
MRITDIPGLMYLWKADNIYLAGQPAPNHWEEVQKLGVKTVINIRTLAEMDFAGQIEIIKSLGMEYVHIPVVMDGMLVAENCKKLSELVNNDEDFFVHCGSANRVAGWFITYQAMFRGKTFDEAIDMAQENGLSNPGFIAQAEQVINS